MPILPYAEMLSGRSRSKATTPRLLLGKTVEPHVPGHQGFIFRKRTRTRGAWINLTTRNTSASSLHVSKTQHVCGRRLSPQRRPENSTWPRCTVHESHIPIAMGVKPCLQEAAETVSYMAPGTVWGKMGRGSDDFPRLDLDELEKTEHRAEGRRL